MSIPATWKMKQYGQGGQYECRASTVTTTRDEATRFSTKWLSTAVTSNAVPVVTLLADNVSAKIYLSATHADPEDCHQKLVDDIKTVEDALVAENTQVTQAIDTEIAAYAAGKITATIGEP